MVWESVVVKLQSTKGEGGVWGYGQLLQSGTAVNSGSFHGLFAMAMAEKLSYPSPPSPRSCQRNFGSWCPSIAAEPSLSSASLTVLSPQFTFANGKNLNHLTCVQVSSFHKLSKAFWACLVFCRAKVLHTVLQLVNTAFS